MLHLGHHVLLLVPELRGGMAQNVLLFQKLILDCLRVRHRELQLVNELVVILLQVLAFFVQVLDGALELLVLVK